MSTQMPAERAKDEGRSKVGPSTESEPKAEGFPELAQVVHPRAIKPGLEWAYVRSQNLRQHLADGWEICRQADTFELGGDVWQVLVRGEPIATSAEFVPRVFAEGVAT